MDELRKNILAGRVTQEMTFSQKVWAITRRIPLGKVATYAQVAAALDGHAYRAVGQALNRNPYAPEVPCHRVVGSTGKLTGFAHGIAQKARLLRQEGVVVADGRVDVSRFAIELR